MYFDFNLLLLIDAIARSWSWRDKAISFRRPVFKCWKAQAFRIGFGVYTRNAIDLLDELVVDLRQSSQKALTFSREDVILSEQFGHVRQGAKIVMTTGTAEVVKV